MLLQLSYLFTLEEATAVERVLWDGFLIVFKGWRWRWGRNREGG